MAYDIGYDVVVYDDNYNQLGQEYVNRAKRFEDVLNKYQQTLQEILDCAVMDGALADNLKNFMCEVTTLKNQAGGAAEAAKKCSKGFLADIDTADSYLF